MKRFTKTTFLFLTVSIFLILFSPLYSQKTLDPDFEKFIDKKIKHTVDEISVTELKKDTSTYLLIDVREKEEFDVSHIKSAKNYPASKFKISQLSTIAKDKKIIIYCSAGIRSEKIANKLKKEGYTNCYNLYGGIFEWINRGYAVYDANGKKTDKIHAYSFSWGIWLNKGVKVFG